MPLWSTKLTRPIPIVGGPTLKTLSDVRAFILAEPEGIQERNSWQHASKALLSAADGTEDPAVVTKRVEAALFLECRWLPPK